MINVFQPQLQKEELQAVKRVFESNWIGKGKITEDFEKIFARYLKVDHNQIHSVNSCTEGLFQAVELLNLKKGDEVILPSISFVGAANAIAASEARPVFCDIDKRTLNTTAQLIEAKITSNTKALIILHYGGVPCDMDDIITLAKNNKIFIIEDSACSVASIYKNKACGTLTDIGVWSFDAMKILVTGDGGMIYCKTPEMSEKIGKMLYLGLVSKSGISNKVDNKWWEFEISSFARRSIMNDIFSSIGIVQLKKLKGFIQKRKIIHNLYSTYLKDLNWLSIPPDIPSYCNSSYYFYWLQMKENNRDKLALYLREKDIYTTFRYYPLHLVKLYGYKEKLPFAEKAAVSTLCIPIHHSLSHWEVDYIISSILKFGKKIN